MGAAVTANESSANTGRLVIRWVKSAIGYSIRQKRTLKALGLTKLGQSVEHPNSPQVRGMVNAVVHLLHVEEK